MADCRCVVLYQSRCWILGVMIFTSAYSFYHCCMLWRRWITRNCGFLPDALFYLAWGFWFWILLQFHGTQIFFVCILYCIYTQFSIKWMDTRIKNEKDLLWSVARMLRREDSKYSIIVFLSSFTDLLPWTPFLIVSVGIFLVRGESYRKLHQILWTEIVISFPRDSLELVVRSLKNIPWRFAMHRPCTTAAARQILRGGSSSDVNLKRKICSSLQI